jgi:hypothetical protein
VVDSLSSGVAVAGDLTGSTKEAFFWCASNLEAIRASASSPLIHNDATVVTTLGSTSMAIEQQAVDFMTR